MFKQVDVTLPGFKYPKCILRELTMAQMRECGQKHADDDTEALLFMVEKGLRNEAGDLVFNESFTMQTFLNESPQSYFEILGQAVKELNDWTDEQELEIAKN
jgi:hypothetical protein